VLSTARASFSTSSLLPRRLWLSRSPSSRDDVSWTPWLTSATLVAAGGAP
jgi:hypothetical protein